MNIAKRAQNAKKEIKIKHGCVGFCFACAQKAVFIESLQDANIPYAYWTTNLNAFYGPELLKNKTIEYAENIKEKFHNGLSIGFIGNLGVGKTLCGTYILKKAIKNNYSAFYTTASDIFSQYMTNSAETENFKYKINNVDFLFIDELDSRFFNSDNVKLLFSNYYENIFRRRTNSALPIIISSNETGNLLEVFNGPAVHSISSLHKQYLSIVQIAGLDFRQKKK